MEIQIFIELALVISVDNVLGAREIDYLLKTGKKLGFGRVCTSGNSVGQ